MFVKAQYEGHTVTALRVGRHNARRYFTRSVASIELELDHLRIECDLPPEFWSDQAEIHDWRLCRWLESKLHNRRSSRMHAELSLTPAGKNCFKLGLVAGTGRAA